MVFKVGTRSSPLALKQVEEVFEALRRFYPALKLEVKPIKTFGDKDKLTPISKIEGTDFFTRRIDQAVLKGEVDFAIHSAKDLPPVLAKGLVIAALTCSVDPTEALVSKAGLKLEDLPNQARIGTSSRNRKAQLKKFRPDFQIIDIRGNIEERLKLLDDNRALNLDAIVIASAGLIRLGLEQRITQRVPQKIMQPHQLQGVLAVVVRENDKELIDILRVLKSSRLGKMSQNFLR
jgi:hydroxymethylbilane synthase